jgi:DNA invertase Pin-like site-specific DNA recombinase
MKRRCAIYTRKSTEEGLEQSFNSLDAQREACAAYVLSQAHEGWELVNEHYDDGGWSGGNMARPALQQLLTDVAAGKVDVIVVYKVDRLTRSLADFARIVEALDKAGASFVSVTQAFNTTTSMGRLTLNVLLSFAQFEREVTSERIRDKVAASKRKGMWMGGAVPIGYRVEDRKLVIVDEEAATVRHIFDRYLALKSTTALANELALAGIRSKLRTYSDGRTRGGCVFRIGSLHQLLRNPLFAGKVKHAGQLYDGEHQAIIDADTWDEVQSIMANNSRARSLGERSSSPSLLTGMIFDPDGRPMTPVFTNRGSRHHRYYVTRMKPGEGKREAWRVPAGDIETTLLDCVAKSESGVEGFGDLNVACIRELPFSTQRTIMLSLKISVRLSSEALEIQFGSDESRTVKLSASLRKGKELRLVVGDGSTQDHLPDASLFRLAAHAWAAQQALLAYEADELVSHYTDRHLYKLLRFSWLAPDIIAAIVEGHQPVELTGRRVLRAADVPLDWVDQRKFFGFA